MQKFGSVDINNLVGTIPHPLFRKATTVTTKSSQTTNSSDQFLLFNSSNQNMFSADLKRSLSEERVLKSRGYKFVYKIGEGGYAKVFLTDYHNPDKPKAEPIKLACKVINIENAPKKFTLKFLPRELTILSQVSHPHIIPIHSIFYRKNVYYIFMRCAERGDLLEYLLGNGAIPEHQVRFWSKQLALAIQYLHILEIAHRDIKCENILITNNNNVQLADFGFARSLLDQENRQVLSDTFCGSLSYAPPEILKGDTPYDPKKADIWSLGILIYTMLNKGNPFESKNIKLFYECQIKRKWKFRTKYANLISQECKDLVTKMLEPEIDKRLKIEDVLNSTWLSMDPTLRQLTKTEYQALNDAMVFAKSRGAPIQRNNSMDNMERISRPSRPSEILRRVSVSVHRNSLTVFKEYNSAFDLQLITSEYYLDKRFSV